MIVIDGVWEETVRPAGYGPGPEGLIFQRQWEFEKLLTLYRRRPPWHVLEVGTYLGGTLYHWLDGAGDGAVVVSVDSGAGAPPIPRKMLDEWCPPGVEAVQIVGDSTSAATVAEVARYAPYDWVFIDGGHDYETVRSDWEQYGAMAAKGAVVAFHDILPASVEWPDIQVEPLWREIQRKGHVTQELVADPAATWGGIGVVYL